MGKSKVMSFRIDENLINEFDQKIIEDYGSTRGHKTEILQQLMNEYINNSKNSKIEELVHQLKDTRDQLHNMEQELKQIEKDKEYYKKSCCDKYKELKKQEKEILELKESNEKLEKTKTKWSNKYQHQVEVNNKLQEECNQTNNKLNKYTYFFGAVTNMSWWNRLLGNYPEGIKELTPAPENSTKHDSHIHE